MSVDKERRFAGEKDGRQEAEQYGLLPASWLVREVATEPLGVIAQLMGSSVPVGVYRGESAYFEHHRSSLGRMLVEARTQEDLAVPVEVALLQQFWHAMNPYLDGAARAMASQACGVLHLMQHCGAPTRFLDWSFSIWVAAYHACSNPADLHNPGYLWACSLEHLNPENDRVRQMWTEVFRARDTDEYEHLLRQIPPSLSFPECVEKTDRMHAQQSVFTCSHPATADHIDLVSKSVGDQCGFVIVIRPEFKREIMQQLHLMNVNAKTLFPGLDGLGRSIRDAAAFKYKLRWVKGIRVFDT